MARAWSLAVVSVLVPFSLLAGPVPEDLPASCQAYLAPRPVETQVLLKRDRWTVEVGAGRAQGLLPGTWLVALETTERLPLCDLEVLSVEEDTAVARGDEDCEALQPGHQVATRWSKSDDPARWPLEVK